MQIFIFSMLFSSISCIISSTNVVDFPSLSAESPGSISSGRKYLTIESLPTAERVPKSIHFAQNHPSSLACEIML